MASEKKIAKVPKKLTPVEALTELALGDCDKSTAIECLETKGHLALFYCLISKETVGMFLRLEEAGWTHVTEIGSCCYLFRKGS